MRIAPVPLAVSVPLYPNLCFSQRLTWHEVVLPEVVSVRADAVAAGVLGGVQAQVRGGEQGIGGLGLVQARDANADGDREISADTGPVVGFHQRAQPVAQP